MELLQLLFGFFGIICKTFAIFMEFVEVFVEFSALFVESMKLKWIFWNRNFW